MFCDGLAYNQDKANNNTIKVNNHNLKINSEYEYNAIETAPLSMNSLTLVVNDKYVENLYVGIYIGIVFLISSAAVLALSQLSSAIENVKRYNTSKKLGVSSEMINKSIAIQVLMYFLLPLSLALVHSIFGIKVANETVEAFGDYDMIKNNISVIGTILVVYGIYFIATYNGYKNIVNK